MEVNKTTELILKDEVYTIIGAAMDVHSVLGCGFLEPVYQEALERELSCRGIPFESQKRMVINYKGKPLTKEYIADLICYEKIIVEIKALEQLTSREESQILNYLKATGCPVGILINFGSVHRLEWRRFANTIMHPGKAGE